MAKAWARPQTLLFATVFCGAGLCGAGWGVAAAGVTDVVASFAAAILLLPLGYGIFRLIGLALEKLETGDFFAPLVAFPLAYILWFSLGTVDFIDEPWHVLYGMFDPMPRVMWLYSALGLAGYVAGVLAVGKVGRARTPSGAKSGLIRSGLIGSGLIENRWRPPQSRAGIWILGALLVGSYVLIVRQIGLPVLSAEASETRLDVASMGGIQAMFLCASWTLMVFLMAGYAARCWSGKAALAGVVATSALLLSLGGRGNFFIGFLTALIAWNYLKRALKLRRLVLAVALLFTAMSAYGYFRDQAFAGDRGLGYLDAAGIPAFVQPMIYAFTYIRGGVATFRDISALIPSEIPYQHGRLTMLPFSTLLPGHHQMADMFFKDIQGHDFVGLGQPATLLGPLYADFGMPGIFGGMFAFGALMGAIYRRMLGQPTVGAALVYAWAMQTALLGLFAGFFPYITTLFVPLLWLGADWFFSRVPPQLEIVA